MQHYICPRAIGSGEPAQNPIQSPMLKRLTALALVPFLMLLTQADLVAQQAPYYSSPQQPYSSGNQYDPSQQYAVQADYDQPAYNQPQPGYAQSPALGPDQLEQLVAPIALNPDPLVALMLAASTYPQQVTAADQWRQAQSNASPDQIAYGANLQPWDPSVKALTAFPQVLVEMDQNIQWTAALGNAYYNQPQDVLQAIQIMRQRAQAAGNLQTTPQQTVTYAPAGYIQLMPANPQVIYVPAYNPWTVYGQPVTPYPGFSLLGAIGSFFSSAFSSSFGSGAVRFGLGTVLSAFSHTPWGLLAWGLDWLAQHLLFNNSNYYSGSTAVADWGLPYGGPRARLAAPNRAFVAYNRGYAQGYQNFNRNSPGPRNAYTGGWSRENYNRNYRTSGYNYNRPTSSDNRTNYAYASNYASSNRSGIYNRQQSPFASRTTYSGNRTLESYNRSPQSFVRPAYQTRYNGNTAYGSVFTGRQQSPFAARSGYASTNNYASLRAPSSSFNERSNSFAGSSAKSSNRFHFFGDSHNSASFGHESGFKSESFKAPKYEAPKEPKFKEPKYKAPKAPKMHDSGGHHSSGGHSGGHHF